MTNSPTSGRLSSFTDLGEAYAQMTATPEFQAAFGDIETLSIVQGDREAQELGMPEPMDAQHDCGAIIATIFDLFRDTRLEASAQSIAWGIVNSFHHEAQKLEREEDRLSQELRSLIEVTLADEIHNNNVEQATLKARTAMEQRAAMEAMRDYAAEMYRIESGYPWSAARGTKVSSASTASQIAAADFLKARATTNRERRHPTGPLVVFSGGQVWHDWQQIYDRLDQIKERVPSMVLCTTAQRKGCDAIAAAWAANRGVQLILFVPESGRYGKRAGFIRNEKLVGLRPVEAVVCQGSGIQSNLLQELKAAGIPTHAHRADRQAAPDQVKPMTARGMLAKAGATF